MDLKKEDNGSHYIGKVIQYTISAEKQITYFYINFTYAVRINPTALRKNLYQLLDQVLESGEPIIIERKGRELVISEKKRKDIYQIMDSRMNEVNETKTELNEQKLQALDENWEANWEKKWDEWLSEK